MNLKQSVHDYWNKASCGTEIIKGQPKYSAAYFAAIEQFRYAIEPEIFAFAQFTRYHGKRVLEVGVGAGTDFVQWVRAGAQAYGIDLTQEAVEHVQRRLTLEGLQPAEVQVADAQQLPYEDDSFDCVYSWGVIHHSPDTWRCFEQMVHVCKPGGTIKFMIYHRRSLYAYYQYLRHGLFKGKPWRSIADILYHHQESIGTKAYTVAEVKRILAHYPVTVVQITTPVTAHDLVYYKAWPYRLCAYVAACLLGWSTAGWFMMVEIRKK